MDKSSNTKKMITCTDCNGCGFIYQEPVICDKCHGKICMYCEFMGGFKVRPFDTCNKCYGYGEIYNNNL